MLRLSISPKAEVDLIDIWVYTCEEWGAEQADEYLDQLAAGMNQLTYNPKLGLDYSHVFPDYRRLQVAHHCVFYRISDSNIIVVRVLHEEMDAPHRLTD